MKVLFLHRGSESLGIEYLSSSLKENGHKTGLIYDPGFEDNLYFKFRPFGILNAKKILLKQAKRFKPDVLAVSTATNTYLPVKNLVQYLKLNLGVQVVLGGFHATTAPEHVIKEQCFDYICRGEGEEAFSEFLNNFDNKPKLLKTRNFWFKQNNKIIRNPVRPPMKDLDKLPFPDKGLFIRKGISKKIVLLISGRGCPHNCSYCINSYHKKMYGHSYLRKRSVGNVIEELKLYREKYNTRHFIFGDDIFNWDINWLELFAKKFKRNIDATYECNTHPTFVNTKSINLLKESGCTSIDIGIQSGNQELRKSILNRGIPDEAIYKAASIIKSAKMKLHTDVMYGSPGETTKDMHKTLDMNKKMQPNETFAHLTYPFPNTDIAVNALKSGNLSKADFKKTLDGLGSFNTSVYLNKNKKEAFKFKVITPLSARFPNLFGKIDSKLLGIDSTFLFRLLNVFALTISDPLEFSNKLFEYMRALYFLYFRS